ncbi:integral membrane sensor signal transduction histidine kinase [Chloroherpeton thalassium ATCC 35110]|uniref:histidine kinase n=1 Tax=Chloroherpeton thalassium (strain ATCC 35110 / GB-78) TaxID=517418 RepID=B3QYF2_CHLT3|nr:HAMP domain-containing sensor histidine kinase [Chloroherpeton thalassium]ACF13580.1 integral membrane sensor signal transduction histidine kinase [Chloroherpeton thalassium ATCC 35110]
MKSSHIKIFFIIAATIGASLLFYYTQDTVTKIRERQRQAISLWVKTLKMVIVSDSKELSYIYSEIITNIDFPAVLTDAENNPVTWRNVPLDEADSDTVKIKRLRELVAQMDKAYEPVAVKIGDTLTLQIVHYGDSSLIKTLQIAPLISLAFVALFFFVAYLSFKYIKQSEESNIWVGMAKETAHQLGTPISALMGWLELLKIYIGNPERQSQIIMDMQADVNRLNRVATRFSKIGSNGELKLENLAEMVEGVFNYYRKRIPNMGKNIELRLLEAGDVDVKVNRELMEWVLENITKNAIDSIENGQGQITAKLTDEERFVCIEITDSGKGIPSKNKKDIFRPGFSTKERGWGLGLSLAKRIVEDYHHGKLILKDSAVGKGSTFLIKLRKMLN